MNEFAEWMKSDGIIKPLMFDFVSTILLRTIMGISDMNGDDLPVKTALECSCFGKVKVSDKFYLPTWFKHQQQT